MHGLFGEGEFRPGTKEKNKREMQQRGIMCKNVRKLKQVLMPADLTCTVFLSQRVDKITSNHTCQSSSPKSSAKIVTRLPSRQLQLGSRLTNMAWSAQPSVPSLPQHVVLTSRLFHDQLGHVALGFSSRPEHSRYPQLNREGCRYRQ